MYQAFSPRAIGFSIGSLDAIPAAAKAGFAGYWFDDVVDAAKRPAPEVAGVLDAAGMIPSGFSLPVNFRDDEARFVADMEELPRVAAFAQEIGLKRCITWIIPSSDELDYADNFVLHQKRLARIAEILDSHGIRLGLEFVGPPSLRRGRKHEFIHTLQQTLELCEAIGRDNLGLLLDVWHWDLAGQRPEDFDTIPGEEYIVLVHLNDAPAGVAPEDQQDLSRALPGATGVLKIGAFMDGLVRIGYSGPALVEPFSAELKAMSFEGAVAETKRSIDRVWPK